MNFFLVLAFSFFNFAKMSAKSKICLAYSDFMFDF